MTKFKTKHKAHVLTKTGAAALITAALLTLALLFTACPQAAAKLEEPPVSTDKTYTVKGISFTMKKIAAVTGKSVGHPDVVGHNGVHDNKPHSISLSAYFIGETEVTQELWQAVMGNNPSGFKGSSNPPDGDEEQGKRPVENMDWYKAISFCNELSKACGLEPCYTEIDSEENIAVCDFNKNGFRLPTEAEWEWAAMGGKDYKWAGTDSESELGNYAWCYANSNEKTHQVKLKLPNGYGLYDMSGNVFEWCWDWYKNSTPAGGQDPTGAESGNMRVMRGGCYDNSSSTSNIHRAYRTYDKPDIFVRVIGLRVVCRP